MVKLFRISIIFLIPKEILKRIGIPYIDSIYEAEAQCASLEKHHIAFGTISDDSDSLLFGSKVLLKNFFSHKRSLECYEMKNIQKQSVFTNQDRFICFASLTGSDYFIGVQGIGETIASEILLRIPDEIEIKYSFTLMSK